MQSEENSIDRYYAADRSMAGRRSMASQVQVPPPLSRNGSGVSGVSSITEQEMFKSDVANIYYNAMRKGGNNKARNVERKEMTALEELVSKALAVATMPVQRRQLSFDARDGGKNGEHPLAIPYAASFTYSAASTLTEYSVNSSGSDDSDEIAPKEQGGAEEAAAPEESIEQDLQSFVSVMISSRPAGPDGTAGISDDGVEAADASSQAGSKSSPENGSISGTADNDGSEQEEAHPAQEGGQRDDASDDGSKSSGISRAIKVANVALSRSGSFGSAGSSKKGRAGRVRSKPKNKEKERKGEEPRGHPVPHRAVVDRGDDGSVKSVNSGIGHAIRVNDLLSMTGQASSKAGVDRVWSMSPTFAMKKVAESANGQEQQQQLGSGKDAPTSVIDANKLPSVQSIAVESDGSCHSEADDGSDVSMAETSCSFDSVGLSVGRSSDPAKCL